MVTKDKTEQIEDAEQKQLGYLRALANGGDLDGATYAARRSRPTAIELELIRSDILEAIGAKLRDAEDVGAAANEVADAVVTLIPDLTPGEAAPLKPRLLEAVELLLDNVELIKALNVLTAFGLEDEAKAFKPKAIRAVGKALMAEGEDGTAAVLTAVSIFKLKRKAIVEELTKEQATEAAFLRKTEVFELLYGK